MLVSLGVGWGIISHLPLRPGRFVFCNPSVLAHATRESPRTMATRMLESKPSPEAGKRLRAERLRVRLSTRAVQKLSQQIAQEKNNQDYYISHGRLSDV